MTLQAAVRLWLRCGAFVLLSLNLFYGGFVIAILRGWM